MTAAYRTDTRYDAGTRQIDYILLAVALLLLTAGLIIVLSSSAPYAEEHLGKPLYFFLRQCVAAVVGLLTMLAAANFHYAKWRLLAYPFLILCMGLLALVFLPSVGISSLGATRWIGYGGARMQPSELAKIAIIVFVAYSLARPKSDTPTFVSNYLQPLFLPFAALALIVSEPDFGTVLLLLSVCFAMLFVSGAPLKHLAMMIASAIPVIIIAVLVFPHILKRFAAFFQQIPLLFTEHNLDYSSLHPHVAESLISFGSGGVTGMGLGNGTLKDCFLPQMYSDFVLATVGQELGFVGTMGLFVLFGALVFRGYRIAWRVPDSFGSFLAFGLTTLLMAQFLMNVGVVTAILPPKGIALPFISYGGSALVVTLFSVGILLNISRHTVSFSNQRRQMM